MIYGVSPSFKQEKMSTQIKKVGTSNKCEGYLHNGAQPLETLENILECLFVTAI